MGETHADRFKMREMWRTSLGCPFRCLVFIELSWALSLVKCSMNLAKSWCRGVQQTLLQCFIRHDYNPFMTSFCVLCLLLYYHKHTHCAICFTLGKHCYIPGNYILFNYVINLISAILCKTNCSKIRIRTILNVMWSNSQLVSI